MNIQELINSLEKIENKEAYVMCATALPTYMEDCVVDEIHDSSPFDGDHDGAVWLSYPGAREKAGSGMGMGETWSHPENE